MYNKIEHKLDRVFNNLQIGDTLESLLFTEKNNDIYRTVKIIEMTDQFIRYQADKSERILHVTYPRHSHCLLQGSLRFKLVEHFSYLKEGNILMWVGEEYLENGCQFYVGQRLQVLEMPNKDTNLSSYVSVITHGRVIKYEWRVINNMLNDGKLVLVRK